MRAEIVGLLERRPYNAHELSRLLGVDYKTARHHLRVLVENGLLVADEGHYGCLYHWSADLRAEQATWREIEAALAAARHEIGESVGKTHSRRRDVPSS